MVDTNCVRRRKDASVRVEVDVSDPNVGQPSLGVESDVPGVPKHEEAAQPVRGSWEPPLAPVASDAVLDDEVAAVDEDADSVAVGDEDAGSRAVPREGLSEERYFVLHAEDPLRVPAPGPWLRGPHLFVLGPVYLAMSETSIARITAIRVHYLRAPEP